jgi:hypothetical protein
MFQKLPGFKNVIAWRKASVVAFLVENVVKNVGAGWWRLAEQKSRNRLATQLRNQRAYPNV